MASDRSESDKKVVRRDVGPPSAESIDRSQGDDDQALRKHLNWLRIALSSIGDAVIATDAKGQVTFMNGVAERLTGWPLDDALGRPLAEVFQIINERTRQPADDPALAALREGSIVGLANHTVLIARDGRECPIDDSAAPMRDESGNPIGAVLVFRDVTERKRAEVVRARLAAIVESSDDAIVSKSLQGIIQSWNRGAERLFGYTAAEAIGQPITLIIPLELHDEEREILARLRRGERIDHYETVRMRKDGRRVEVALTISPVRDSTGNIVGASKIGRDISERRRSEALLRESEERRRKLADNLPSGFIYQIRHSPDDSRQFTYVSAGVETLCGVTAREVMQAPARLYGLIAEEDRARVRAAEDAAMRDFGAFDCEFRIRGRDGRLRWLHCRSAPRRQPDSEGVIWDGIAIDVTDRRRVEQELAASRDQLRIILRGVADGITVQDLDGRLLFANEGAAKLTGCASPEELLATPSPELMSRFELFDEDGRPLSPRDLPGRRALAGEGNPEAVIKFRLVATGEERWSLVRANPVRDSRGEIQFSISIFHEITERKRAEQTQQFLADVGAVLAGSLDFQTTLTSVARLCVPRLADWCSVDVLEPSGNLRRLAVAHVDPEKMRWALDIQGRYPPEPNSPRGVHQVIRTGESELYPEIPDQRLVEAARDAEHLRILRKLGMTSVMIVPLRARGQTLGALSLVAAESRRRFGPADLSLAEEVGRRAGLAADNARLFGEAVEADRRKDEFLALLAHELRNPLAPLGNGLQVMRLAPNDAGAVAQARAMMERQLAHLVRLVDDLLDVSRISRNKMELRRSRVLLADAISSAVETARPAIDAAGHELTISLPPEPIYLDADLTRLAQVFGNLLTNSAKYTERGGRIWLTVTPDGDQVTIKVQDSGIGIPASALPTLFDMFSQVERSIERSAGGLGIGLALVKGLVEMHGGAVEAASAGPGQGSTFTVRLPVLRTGDGLPTAPAIEPSEPAESRKRRVLVVDDNQDSATSMSMMLRLMGDKVQSAHDGLEAIDIAASFRPHVILMDMGMPRLNGFEATRRIREQPWGKSTIIIAVTGWGQDADKARSREAGCDGHLVKPVDHTELARLLAELTGARRKEDN